MTDTTMVAEQLDVATRVRSARADLANRALQLRTIEADIARLEQPVDEGRRRAAKELLRISLDELVDRRRAELDDELAEARARAAQVIADAREQAAIIGRTRPSTPEPPPERAPTERRPADALLDHVAPTAAPVEPPPPVTPTRPRVGEALLAAVEQAESPGEEVAEPAALEPEIEAPPPAPQLPAMPAEPVASAGPAVLPSPEYIAQIVQAAVSASLSHLSVTPQVVTSASSSRTRGSRLLHLDVLLPLVLVFIVALVTLAWVS